ncbi:hypothetical protein F5876DRAFT_71235 [Lentinula aff. lateritia]|uniref:Uncharacterized protein n=1 Tax=Lentinula aff. lateritia TaxID=2804960 RepID=A0ACC1TGI6_9AGAR|nr:hypothetical protein F5876DRAFT_71235 [Lentinula aff. lateritia]
MSSNVLLLSLLLSVIQVALVHVYWGNNKAMGLITWEYLEAVLTQDEEEVEHIETEVEIKGYGPRTACHNVMNFSSQRPICPWVLRLEGAAFSHRDTKGVLKQPRMKQVQCSCIFREYEPVAEFRTTCPYILVTSKGPHSHPIPLPEKTPNAVKVELYDLIK